MWMTCARAVKLLRGRHLASPGRGHTPSAGPPWRPLCLGRGHTPSAGPPRRPLCLGRGHTPSAGPPWRPLCLGRGHTPSAGPPWRPLCLGRGHTPSAGPPWRPLCLGRGHTPSAGPPWRPLCPGRRHTSSAGPPWNVLFFGTDHFALESLKVLWSSRKADDSVVQSLEVVTLSGDVPVKRFAQQNSLAVHGWPPDIDHGQFDVGVVVSFGCLLPQKIINKFPFGVLNVHPSLLPRWRGPAPIFHTILQGDELTGVTVMQIRPHRFDVGPILSQETYHIQNRHTSDELGDVLALKGAQMLIDTLKNLREKLQNKKEQSTTGATFAPKINKSWSWLVWEEQSTHDIDCLSRAIGSRIPLRTLWMGRTVKLLDFTGKCHNVVPDGRAEMVPGSVFYLKESNILSVCCKDGWVGFRSVLLKKRLSAADFYNGYLHQSLRSPSARPAHGLFVSALQHDHIHHINLPTT